MWRQRGSPFLLAPGEKRVSSPPPSSINNHGFQFISLLTDFLKNEPRASLSPVNTHLFLCRRTYKPCGSLIPIQKFMNF